ncbi:MAG: hypothetical protein JRI68_18330 [Deltaproteobacteria bacterium]|nr:hypothetical protein [Deltaproteobacteria bacterium]
MNQSEDSGSEGSADAMDGEAPEPDDQADVARAPAPKASLTEAELPDLEELLAAAPELLGAALFDRHGKVLGQAGEVDAEALGAFVVPAQRTVHDTVEELSLGAPERWCLSTDSECWYAIMLGSKRLVAVGEPTKHPATTLRKLPVGEGSTA